MATQNTAPFKRGLWLALALALLLLVGTAVQSVATLLFRMRGDVMKAASGIAWTGAMGREVVSFVGAQLLLHLGFGLLAWLLAVSIAALWPRARDKFAWLVVGWFCLLAMAVIAYNSYWFPRTGLGAYYYGIARIDVGPWGIGQIVYAGVTAAAAITVLAALVARLSRVGLPRARPVIAIALGAAAIGLATAMNAGHDVRAQVSANRQRPHIILLGIDSLRLDQLQRFGGTGVTPNLDRFLARADLVRDATTPVARTFPSWSAILTARDPTVTGVRFNLVGRDVINVNPTIGDVLRKEGYRSVYSTDEVRFANIDESFGFDQVITPPIGAADFIIGTYNELPLVTVIANTWLGKWLFPYSFANRGAATMYQPASYLARLDDELSFDHGPTFLITHLTASHWPNFVSDTPFGVTEKKSEDDRPIYRVGLEVADRMLGEVVAMLERKGALENAIVVVLSDHGEAMALSSDTMIADGSRVPGLKAPIGIMDMGHGQSVLSPVQYQCLLAFRTFGTQAGFAASGRDIEGGATVEDIAPTLLDLVGVDAAALAATGKSFAPVLRGEPGADRVSPLDRVRYTETDLKVLPSTDGEIDEVATAQQNSKFFEVVESTGRLSVRKGFMPLSLAFKERAAFTEQLLIAAIPAGPDAHQYLLVDKATQQAQLLLERPGSDKLAAQQLWDAMWKHYAGELRQPVAVTREDWPAIEEGWRTFFTKRHEAPSTQQPDA